MTDPREVLGRLVRETWVKWAAEQPDPKSNWLTGWDELDGGQREVDMRIGEAVAAAVRERDAEACTACGAQIARLERHLDRLAREHARHALAVSAHKARADQQESRAVRAEKMLARFARYAEEYDGLAEQAAQGYRNADLVTELRRRIVVLERQAERARRAEAKLAEVRQRCREAAGIADLITGTGGKPIKASPLIDAILAITGTGEEPLSATCTGPGCGEQFADSETGEYLFATRERMERLLHADGWAADPVLCPACQQEEASS